VSKVIVITGAGDGLGRALARRFARDGETVILLGRTLSKVEAVAQELGDPHFAVACDVGNPDSVRAAFAAVLANRLFRDWLYPAGLADDASIDAAIADFVLDGINANRG